MSWYDELFTLMETSGTEEQSIKMAAYMQNMFPFRGIPKPELKVMYKPFLAKVRKEKINWEFVTLCWKKDYREAQYVGVEYLLAHKKELTEKDLPKIKTLIETKSWWETTDSLDELVGLIVAGNPALKKVMLVWSTDNNIWVRRTAIDFQQKYKENTDIELLEQIVINNLGSKEFFINKAIGWSLREYAKEDPDRIKSFIEKYRDKMASLSIKEALKHL